MYNVGPEFSYQAQEAVECKGCGSNMHPQWNGFDGVWECSECFKELPDFKEKE